MMNRLDLYITRHVLGAIFIVTLVIVGLDMLFALVDQLPDLKKDYQIKQAAYFVAMTGPRRLYEHLPLCSLIGCLLGLGALASSSELTVMRAAGISTARIIGAVMKPVLAIIVAALLLGEYVVPKSEQEAQSFRTIATSANGKSSAASLQKGLWHREGTTFLNVKAVTPEGEIYGVTRYRFNDQWQLESAGIARRGYPVADGWQLEELRETHFKGERTEVVEKTDEHWVSGLTPELLSTLIMEPGNLSIQGLSAYTGYLDEQGLAAEDYQVAFWGKMLMPLAIMGLVLVAVSFIFGPLRSVTVGQRLIAGVVVGLLFKLAQDLLGPAATVYGLSPLLAVMLPILVSFVAGGLLLRRAG